MGLWKSNCNGSASHHRRTSQIFKAVACSAIHRQCKSCGPTVCRATWRTSKWRSNDTRKGKRTLMRPSHPGDGRRGTALIASKNRQSRQRRPSGESLCFGVRTINIVMTLDMMGMALRGHRTANTWAMATVMVATFSRLWRCKRGSTRSCRIPRPTWHPAGTAQYRNTIL